MKKIITFIISICTMLSLVGCSATTQSTSTHAFSVSDTQQVYFADANLQYCPKTDTWRFAENSYDIIGMNNENISENDDGWIDLFAWGASGLTKVKPYSINEDNTYYGDGHNSIADTEYDFSVAVNKQMDSNWRMFTHDEIHYLLMYRNHAEKLFGYGTIEGIRGLFILPDDWSTPDDISFTPASQAGFENQYDWYYTNGEKENYTYNNYTKDEWKLIQKAGAVFLPAAGMRSGTSCDHINISGHYWTSSNYGEEFANCLCLFEHDLFLEGNFDRSYGLGVRLIKDA